MTRTDTLTARNFTPRQAASWLDAIVSESKARPVVRLTTCCRARVVGNHCAACGVFRPSVS